MNVEVTPDFGAQDLPDAGGEERLSVALIGPDERRRRLLATAITNLQLAKVREFRSYPKAADDLQWLLGQSYDVIILDLDDDQDATLDLVQRIGADGSATVMVYSEKADQKLAVRIMRAGAREYLLLPLEEGVVAEALARVANSPRSKISPTAKGKTLGSLHVFLGAKGGSGVTTAACNLAIALARLSEQKTLLIDLTLPIGDAALALGLTGEYSTEDALLSIDRLDASLLERFLVKHNSGLMLLPAPSMISQIEASSDAIDKLIAVARAEFGYVIVDMGSKIDVLGSGVFKNATIVYLITQTSISDLRNSNRLISQYFTESGPKLEVVLNRFEPRLLEAVDEDVVAKALGRPVRWKIPDDEDAAREMQHGETGNSESRILRVSLEMASSITGRPVPQKKRKGFGLKGLSKSTGADISEDDAPPSVTIAPRKPREPRVYARRAPNIKWPTPSPIHCGDQLTKAQLNATASVPGTFEFNPGFGEVLPAGTHTLSAVFMPADSDKHAIAQATVSLEVVTATATVAWSNPDPITSGTPLSATQLNATASVSGTFDYSPAAGEVLAAGTHTLSVTFTPTDIASYASAEASVSLDVTIVTPIIDWPTPQPIQCGAALSAIQLCATAPIPGTLDYSPAEGEVLAAGTHTLSVTFTPTDAENYAASRATVSLDVTRVTPTIDWPTPQPINEGMRLNETQLCAIASVPGRFEYSPAPGETLTAGTHSLLATFIPTDSANYAPVRASVPLTVVAKTIPVITWPTPEPIPYGTLIGPAQLSATASVPGAFSYSPELDEKLNAGTHILSALFTPSDGFKYASTKANVSLEVLRLTPSIDWPAPQPIKDDAALSSIQLCATASVPGTFDYSPAQGEMLAAGTHTLSATFNAIDSINYASTQATVSLTVVAKAIPVIEWTDPEPVTYGALLSNVQLCATASVPGTFEYSPALGEALTAGKHTLRATFMPTDSENYASTQAAVSLEVAMITPSIEWPSPDPISYGTPLDAPQLCATSSLPGTFDYSPAPGEMLTAGSHTLSARFTPTDRVNFTPAAGTVSLEVVKATPTINWPPPSTVQYGTGLNSTQLCARASVPGSFVYSPAPGDVLEVGNHTLSVTFRPDESANYSTAQSAVSLEVTKATPSIAWPDLEPITFGTPLSATQFCAQASVPGKLNYSHEPGEMFTAGVHTLSVVLTPEDKANFEEVKTAVSLVVNKITPTIEWPTPNPIQCGEPLKSTQLCAAASVSGTFEYSPALGTVLPAGTHTLSVTFTPTDGVNHGITQASVPLDVAKGTLVISWSTPAPIPYGTQLSASQLCATASVPGKFDYSPAMGDVLAVGTQTLSVTVTPADSASYATTKAAVSLEVIKATPVIDWPTPQPITCDLLLGAKQLCAATSVPGSFHYTPASGDAVPAGTHTLTVTFTPLDRTSYATTQATVLLEVVKVTPSIDWAAPRPITHGIALSASQLNAAAWVPGSFAYSPGLGEVLPEGIHTLSVTFTPKDCASYAVVQATVQLNVIERPKPVITWPKPYPISYGTRLSSTQLGATASIPGTFEYSTAAGEVLPVGTHELSVTFTPNAILNYDKARASVSLQVVPATPAISWSNPYPIKFGTPIGSTQLCATASVPGAFDYSPEPGTELKAGKHMLAATFTPADSANYAKITTVVSIDVTRATPTIDWETPKPIRFGARLNAAQLCSTASVPGTFYYSPSLGDVLTVGFHTLSVSFTPSDTEQYETTQTTAVLEVRKPFRWGGIVAALSACMILLALVLVIPSLNSGKNSTQEPSVQPSPAATEAQPQTTPPRPSSRAKVVQNKPTAKEGKNNQKNAPTPIPQEAKNQLAGNTPPASKGDTFSQALDWISMRIYECVDASIQFFERQAELIRNIGK